MPNKDLIKSLKNVTKPRKLGKKLSIPDVANQFVIPLLVEKKRRHSTLSNLARDVRRFETWWSSVSNKPLNVADIRRGHLEAFRKHLSATGASVPLQNYALRSIAQILNAAVRHELIPQAPKLECLEDPRRTPRIYPDNEEFGRLWDACQHATWPKKTDKGKPLSYAPEVQWKVALLLYRLYGFRTQELVKLEESFRSLTWKNIHPAGITPNPEGKLSHPIGWLAYVPQKQERVKPQPLVVPLTIHSKAALRIAFESSTGKHSSVLNWPLSSISFYNTWERIRSRAGVFPRPESGEKDYHIKHLRKAATTEINLHRPGLAEYIIGHSSDRSMSKSIVSDYHYNNPEQAVVECMKTLPVPACFDQILDYL